MLGELVSIGFGFAFMMIREPGQDTSQSGGFQSVYFVLYQEEKFNGRTRVAMGMPAFPHSSNPQSQNQRNKMSKTPKTKLKPTQQTTEIK